MICRNHPSENAEGAERAEGMEPSMPWLSELPAATISLPSATFAPSAFLNARTLTWPT